VTPFYRRLYRILRESANWYWGVVGLFGVGGGSSYSSRGSS